MKLRQLFTYDVINRAAVAILLLGFGIDTYFYTVIYDGAQYASPSADRTHQIELKKDHVVYVGDGVYRAYQGSEIAICSGIALLLLRNRVMRKDRPK